MTRRWKGFTPEELSKTACASLNRDLIESLEGKKKKSKYGNSKTEVNGEKFDSIREAKRYKELLILQKLGEIGQLRRQVEYELNEGGEFSYIYRADFVYVITKTGETVVEDSKGCRTREYLKKRRLMKKVHGITIKET